MNELRELYNFLEVADTTDIGYNVIVIPTPGEELKVKLSRFGFEFFTDPICEKFKAKGGDFVCARIPSSWKISWSKLTDKLWQFTLGEPENGNVINIHIEAEVRQIHKRIYVDRCM